MMKIRKRMTTVISRTVALMIVGGFFVSAGHAQEKGKSAGSEAIAQLYAGAKKEGTVIIWGPTDAIIYQKMQAVLDKHYPGIKIEHFESIPEPLVQRIIAESQAGKPASVDIIQSGSLRAVRPLIDRPSSTTRTTVPAVVRARRSSSSRERRRRRPRPRRVCSRWTHTANTAIRTWRRADRRPPSKSHLRVAAPTVTGWRSAPSSRILREILARNRRAGISGLTSTYHPRLCRPQG